MKKALIGLVASFAFIGLSQTARAHDVTDKSSSTGQDMNQSTQGTGGSGMNQDMNQKSTLPSSDTSMNTGTTMDRSSSLSSNELTGRVVKADNNTVYIEHMGAVVALKVDHNTKFESPAIRHAKDLQPGQEIRASFAVKNQTDNVARSISLSSTEGTGGAGLKSYDYGKSGADTNKDQNKMTPPSDSTQQQKDQNQQNLPGETNPSGKTY